MTHTCVVFVDLEKVQINVSDHAGGGGILKEIDPFWIAKRKNEDERGDDDREAAIQVKSVAEERITGEGVEEAIPLIS